MKFGIGQPVRRFEDVRLLTGKGRFQDDQSLARQAYAVVMTGETAKYGNILLKKGVTPVH